MTAKKILGVIGFVISNFVIGCVQSDVGNCHVNPFSTCGPCNLDCPDYYECFWKKSDQEVCILQSDLSCKSNIDCPYDTVCDEGLCKEKECVDRCQENQSCVLYPDDKSIYCSNK